MSNQIAQTTWSLKYQAKNDRVPPPIYEQVNASVLAAQPVEANPKEKIPRLPQEHDFPKYIENRIIDNASNEDIQYIIVVLHGYGADTFALWEFSKKHLLGPKTACVLVRGTNSLESDGTYCWSDQGDFIGGPGSKIRALQARRSWKVKRQHTGLSSIQSSTMSGPSRSNTAKTTESFENVGEEVDASHYLEDDEDEDDTSRPTFEKSTEQIGLEVITNVLIKKCGFKARNIALVGHDQGGSAALAVAAACWETQYGGVVSIGGRLPSDFPDQSPNGARSPTHALLLGGRLGDVDNKEVARIESTFAGTTKAQKPGKSDDFDDIEDTKLKEFLAHHLWREEWTKEAVVTFDGGGIRGYGSLLMLKELMIKIAQHERHLDRMDDANGEPLNSERRLSESSFSPCEYPPIERNGKLVARNPNYLEDDDLYLPCHYFTFVGGTSTGGLISIMISRFRMTVRDCLEAYEGMGRRVFGNPRPPVDFGIAWHKFDADRLEEVIRDVVSRHGEKVDTSTTDVRYPSPEAFCKTIVAARADKGVETVPFLFRTYDCRADDSLRPQNPPLNAGRAAQCSIVEVGRATSAAPGFFRPIDIKNWGATGYAERKQIQFVDGGFGLNNPSHEILLDIKRKLRAPNAVFDVFASFGTGVSDEPLEGKLSTWNRLMKEMKREMTNVLRAHEAMENECGIRSEDAKKIFEYFRFNGGKALGKIKMDDWSGRRKSQWKLSSRPTGKDTLDAMADATNKYLKTKEVKDDLTKLAEILVLRRRLRTRDKAAWDRYACASRYECSQNECDTKVDTLDEFRVHLDDAHANLSNDDSLSAIRGSRRCWTYRGVGDED